MSEPDLVLTAVPIYLGIAAVLFLVQWPARPQAIRLLQRWGVSEPTDPEIAEARHYLRRRQLAYPLFYLVYSISTLLLLPDPPPLLPLIVAIMITGGLFAEVMITWRTGPAVVPADLAPRHRARALIPAWAFTLAVLLLAALALLTGAALLGQPWAMRVIPDPVPTLACGAAAALFSTTTIWLTVRRPPRPAARADAALRLCTARTSLALGMLAVSGVAALSGSPAGYAFAALGLAAAFATTSSGRKRGPAVATRDDEAVRQLHATTHRADPVQLGQRPGQPRSERARWRGQPSRLQRGPAAQAGGEPSAE
jgi:hypothetical protein